MWWQTQFIFCGKICNMHIMNNIGLVHYCVANMPGCVALSSTMALTSVTNKYGLEIANKGVEAAVDGSEPIRLGVNTYKGKLVYKPVADAFGLEYFSWSNL